MPGRWRSRRHPTISFPTDSREEPSACRNLERGPSSHGGIHASAASLPPPARPSRSRGRGIKHREEAGAAHDDDRSGKRGEKRSAERPAERAKERARSHKRHERKGFRPRAEARPSPPPPWADRRPRSCSSFPAPRRPARRHRHSGPSDAPESGEGRRCRPATCNQTGRTARRSQPKGGAR